MDEADKRYIRSTIRRILREELASFGAALASHLEEQTFASIGGYDGAHELTWEEHEGGAPELGFGAIMRQRHPEA